jgi:uncharacterized protein (TIGR03435 family)
MDQFRLMLQALLAERFQLKLHHVQKNLPIYNLEVSKNGPKLKQSAPGTKFSAKGSSLGSTGVRWEMTAVTIPGFLENQLGVYARRPVFDKTGLSGKYDITFEFVLDNLDPGATATDPGGPSLFTALQEQLGLKLESATAPFDTIVIDHAEKPSQN